VPIRALVEAQEFSEQLAALGDVRDLDKSLHALRWGLETQVEKFKLVPGFQTIRIAKDWRLKLAIIFQIQGDRVLQKWIERLDEPGIFEDDDDGEE
jgi:hypothetical protein